MADSYVEKLEKIIGAKIFTLSVAVLSEFAILSFYFLPLCDYLPLKT